MFGATKTWRRWHRKINLKTKRYAVCSAIAATAIPSLVMARGHQIAQVKEVPCVVDDSIASITKTKAALAALKGLGAMKDVEKSAEKKIRAGKGKWRNRRYITRKGPLVVTTAGSAAEKSFRNIPGVEVANVEALNLLKLAPGGHMGRFCIWTKSAFEKLDSIFGTPTQESAVKKGWKIPAAPVANSDLARVVNDDAIQSVVNPIKSGKIHENNNKKKNPLKNRDAMRALNPAWKPNNAVKTAGKKKYNVAPAAKKAFYKQMIADSDYQGDDYDLFNKWLFKNKDQE
jgi:large subunit ribosomal protein L4e